MNASRIVDMDRLEQYRAALLNERRFIWLVRNLPSVAVFMAVCNDVEKDSTGNEVHRVLCEEVRFEPSPCGHRLLSDEESVIQRIDKLMKEHP